MIDYEKLIKERNELRVMFKENKGRAKNLIAKKLRSLDQQILNVEVFERTRRKEEN